MLHEQVSILVVDDVNTMRAQIKELLKTFGFKLVTLSSNGEEAKRFLEIYPCHLILADWHMTPTDGMDLLKWTRNNPKFAKMPFLMVTAECAKEKVVEAIKGGVDDYLVKPLTKAQIETKIYGVLLKKGVLG